MSPPGYPSAWLHPCRARFRFARQCHFTSLCRCAAKFSFLSRLLQFAVARRMDFRLPPSQHVGCFSKSCTLTLSGSPLGCHSRPPFLYSPTCSFFFASTEIAG